MNDGPGQTILHENSLLSTAFQKDTEAQLFHYIRDSDFSYCAASYPWQGLYFFRQVR